MNITDDQLKQRDAVSDTPRTDADYALHGGSVCPEFARILERELAAVTADLEFRRDLGALQQQEYDKVTAERDVLKADLCAFVAFAVDMEKQLSAVAAERDALKADRETELFQMAGYLSAELTALHSVEAGEIMRAVDAWIKREARDAKLAKEGK